MCLRAVTHQHVRTADSQIGGWLRIDKLEILSQFLPTCFLGERFCPTLVSIRLGGNPCFPPIFRPRGLFPNKPKPGGDPSKK